MVKIVHIKPAEPIADPLVTDEPESKERALLNAVRANMKYNLQDLIDECDPNQPLNEDDSAWLNGPPVGREVL